MPRKNRILVASAPLVTLCMAPLYGKRFQIEGLHVMKQLFVKAPWQEQMAESVKAPAPWRPSMHGVHARVPLLSFHQRSAGEVTIALAL
mmetsp:Transcript_18865/g.57004  ORF Transcript_18865/g.57004 Transcript_18865/m.57004 type:complete len:89 (+) Transcript_18865:354-620(+)